MAAPTTALALDPVLKILYRGQRIQELVYKKFRFLGVVKKNENFQGKMLPLPIRYGGGGGRSASLGLANDNSTHVDFEAFELVRKNDFCVGGISGEALEASASDQGSFVRGLKSVFDAKILEISRSLEHSLFRSGHGLVARIVAAGAVNAATLQLATIEDAASISVGDVLNATNNTVFGANRVGGGTEITAVETVAGVDYSTGVLTSTSAVWNTVITDLAALDWLTIQGDSYAYGTDGCKKIYGLQQWMPPVALTGAATFANNQYSETFLGVNRATSSLLRGAYLNAAAYPTMEEAVIDGIGMANDQGGSVDLIVMHPKKYRRLVKELGSKVHYDKMHAQGSRGAMASIGFDTLVIEGDSGPVRVMADVFCPFELSWALDMSTITLNTLGAAPKFLMADGNKILRTALAAGSAAADIQYDFDLGYRGELGVDAPGFNCCITLPT